VVGLRFPALRIHGSDRARVLDDSKNLLSAFNIIKNRRSPAEYPEKPKNIRFCGFCSRCTLVCVTQVAAGIIAANWRKLPRVSARHPVERRRAVLRFWVVAFGLVITIFYLLIPCSTHAEERAPGPCHVLVVAFVGGLGPASFPPTMATPILHKVRDLGYPDLCMKMVSSYWPWSATRWVHKEFAASRGANDTEDHLPKLIVFGYSLGAAHAIRFARAMQHEGIAIEELVTVDTKGPNDGIVPDNVRNAANFYERWLYPLFYPLYYGKKNIRAEDPTKTNFRGNLQVQHAGHFTIVNMSNVRQLLCEAVREAYHSEPTQARSFPRRAQPTD
jgi:pimeloyl-ACP methyl ester carboxylesterase